MLESTTQHDPSRAQSESLELACPAGEELALGRIAHPRRGRQDEPVCSAPGAMLHLADLHHVARTRSVCRSPSLDRDEHPSRTSPSADLVSAPQDPQLDLPRGTIACSPRCARAFREARAVRARCLASRTERDTSWPACSVSPSTRALCLTLSHPSVREIAHRRGRSALLRSAPGQRSYRPAETLRATRACVLSPSKLNAALHG